MGARGCTVISGWRSLWSAPSLHAWYRFGSPFRFSDIDREMSTALFIPDCAKIGDDYQSGTRLPHSIGSANLLGRRHPNRFP
jgi:hypothetical protein